MKKQKVAFRFENKYWITLVILILFLIYVGSRNLNILPFKYPTQIGWQTYQTGNFSFKYPPFWAIKEVPYVCHSCIQIYDPFSAYQETDKYTQKKNYII